MSEKCQVPGCEVMIFGDMKICAHHWHRVPKVLQDALQRIKTDDDQYRTALAACVEAAALPVHRGVSYGANGYPRGPGVN